MADNPGAALIRAVQLPLRDVHDLCATGDVDYLIDFAHDEDHRASHGLGRPHSASRKATSPVRRAEHLQASKVAEIKQREEEARELAARQRKRDENKRRRKAEREAEARADAAGGGGEEYQSDAGGSQADGAAPMVAADHDEYDEEEEDNNNASSRVKNPELLVSVGAGSTDNDRVPIDKPFPRPRLGRTAAAASEEAANNTVGLGIVSVNDLVNFRDEHGLLPIHTACVFGQRRIIEFLMEHGADIESVCPRTLYRPLHLAVLNGHDALARTLVETYNADPGTLTADFELPLTIARRRRVAELELYFKEKCRERIKSSNALQAALDGELLFFAWHSQCDADGGSKCFTEEYQAHRPADKARPSSAGATGVSLEVLVRDPVTTPLDIAIASMTSPHATEYKVIAEILLRGRYYNLNEPRDSPNATTTLYLAVTVPTREGISLLLQHGADPRVASAISSAPNAILKLTLAEAEARFVFEDFYKTKDDIGFEERAEFVNTATGLRDKWRKSKKQLQKALNREEAIAAANAAQE